MSPLAWVWNNNRLCLTLDTCVYNQYSSPRPLVPPPNPWGQDCVQSIKYTNCASITISLIHRPPSSSVCVNPPYSHNKLEVQAKKSKVYQFEMLQTNLVNFSLVV